MAFAQSVRSGRPIPGAVATLGVSDRVAFLRKTYALLGAALLGFAGLTGAVMLAAPETSYRFSAWALSGNWTWLAVMLLFMGVGTIAQKLATSDVSHGRQLMGLVLSVVAWSILTQPILWVCFTRFHAGDAMRIVSESVVITLAIFVGLTLSVFVSKKDFSFMRGALMIGSFAAIGIILASMLFGFQLGALFAGAMIVLMAGYILYQTSLVMSQFAPGAHVAAALMLFSTVATLFWYVLMLMMDLNGGGRRR